MFRWAILAFFVCAGNIASTAAESFEAEVTIDATRAVAIVTGKFQIGDVAFTQVNLSFAGSVAGHNDLAKRISGVQVFDQHGNQAPLRKMIDSEYLGERGIFSWRYEVDLSPLKDRNATAHASWLSGGKGILMLGDVLPTTPTSGKVRFRVPPGWQIYSTEQSEGDGVFNVSDSGRAVFAIGRDWQKVSSSDPKVNIDLLITGSWQFTPAEAAAIASEIFLSLQNVFRTNSGVRYQVILSNFLSHVGPGQWEAETRGNNVTIISSDMPFKTQSLQRLHEQLRHELFHLWIPTGVNLIGNYDWFYEGFALYQSLKLAVSLNRIRFEDFLDTLSRAHTIDSAQSQRPSLIQASTNRFGGSNTQVYARGMLVAFLTDLTMLEQSKGKRSVEDLLKDLYARHRKPTAPTDGNAAVIEMLRTQANAAPVVDKYITGAEKIDWTNDLAATGIEDSDPGPLTTLRVKEKLKGSQKAMLDKLGYNNWRKLSVPSK